MEQLDDRIGLSGVAAVLPPHRYGLDALADAGLLASEPSVLAQFGFTCAYLCDESYDICDMAVDAARTAISDAGLQPHEIDVLICASARCESAVCPPVPTSPSGSDVLQGFRYMSAWLQNALELNNANVVGVAQQGCSTMFSAIRLARALLVAEPQCEHVLCVGLDVLPSGAGREIFYNVISDAASAVVVSRGCDRDLWRGYGQLSRGYYWDPVASRADIIAAYFPTAKAFIHQLLLDNQTEPGAIDVVIPTGVSRVSWEILLRLIDIPADRLQCALPSFGHTMTSDTFLYLEDVRRRGSVARGSQMLLFTYGFGSSWAGLLLEH